MVMPIAGGIGLATRKDGDPDSPSTAQSYFDGLIRDSAQQAWSDYRTGLQQTLHDQLCAGDRIAPGVTLYDLNLQIAEHVDLSVERDDAGDLVVHVVTDGCYVEATSTTPTDLGSWADPRVSIAFSLDLTYRIDLPPTNAPLQSTGFEQVHVLSPTLDSHNFVADVAFMINDIIGFFSGQSFVGLIEGFIASTDFAPYVNRALAPLNDELTRLAGEGYWFLEAVVDRLDGASGGLHGLSVPGAPSGRLDLLLTVFGFDTSGAIEGQITWPSSLGAPATPHDAALARALTQRVSTVALSAVTSALVTERTRTWTAVTAAATDEAAAIVLPDAAAARATPAAAAAAAELVATPAAAAAGDAIAGALQAMPEGERPVAAQELRSAQADRFVELVGGPAQFARLRDEFLKGRSDFTVPVTVAVGGAGLFPDQHPVGSLASLWAEDDATTCRRRFLVVNLPIDAALDVRCALSTDYVWSGSVQEVACVQAGWAGTVTIHHAPAVPLAQALDDQVELQLPDRRRVFSHSRSLEERGIIIVGGRDRPGDAVALNPQPLPPREIAVERAGVDRQVFAAAANPRVATQVTDAGLSVELASHHDRRWGTAVTEVSGDHASAVAAMTRQDPSGKGTVRGIDFRVEEYVAPVIH